MSKKSKFQISAEYALARSIILPLSVLGVRASMAAGAALGYALYHLLGGMRRIALINLGIAFPEMPPSQRKRLAKRSFQSYGRGVGAVIHLASLSREKLGDLIDGEVSPDERSVGERGRIILGAHLGNWELGAAVMPFLFGPVHALARRIDNPKIDALATSMRTRFGTKMIDKDGSAPKVIRVLRDGGSVLILADVNTHPKESVFVPFFGVAASTTTGVALLAIRTRSPIEPAFLVWDASKRKYIWEIGEAIEPADTGDLKADILETTARFTAEIERAVRKYPDQWLWIHRRWKARPVGTAEIY